jgi:hypothetical protein
MRQAAVQQDVRRCGQMENGDEDTLVTRFNRK